MINFGIYNKTVINEVLKMGDYNKSLPLFVYFVGFERTAIEVEHAERESGKSNYTISKLLELAFNSIIAYSNKPLKLFVKLGLCISLLSFLIGIYYFILFLRGEIIVMGYASIIVSLFFLSGVMISIMGFVGVYIGKNFEQSKNRPAYIFDN